MGDWVKLDLNNKDTYPSFLYPRKDGGKVWETDRVLCAIKAPLLNGEVRYLVKEGKGQAKYLGSDSKPTDPKFVRWLIPGSQNEVVAWMPLPEYNEDCDDNTGKEKQGS